MTDTLPNPADAPVSCNSWVIRDRATGSAVLETWCRGVAAAVNRDRYEVLTAHEHLASLNHKPEGPGTC